MYIKLDKKLIVNIKQLTFKPKKTTTKSSFDDIKANIKKFPTLLKYFQKIDIERLVIADNEFSLYFDKKQLYLDNKYVNLSTKVRIYSKSIYFDLYSLYLKDVDVLLRGSFKLDLFKEIATFVGNYSYKDIDGDFNVQANKDYIDFYVNTKDVENIKFVKDFVNLPKTAEEWMYDNVTGKMKLNYLYGKLKTTTFEPVLDKFKGNATIKNANIRFNKKAKVVTTDNLSIDYKDNKLIFNMDKPIYNNSTKIYGSSVVINHLTSQKKGEVVINIKTKSALNEDIIGILKSYDINLPLIQTKGTTDSDFTLTVPYLISRGMKTTGDFIANDATFKLQNFVFDTQKANVKLRGPHVIIENSHVKHNDMIDGVLNLDINTNDSTAKGDILLNRLLIKSKKDSIIDAKNVKSSIFVSFKDDTILKFDDLKTNLDITKDSINISIADLSKIYDYSSLLQSINLKKGNINLQVFDENNIDFDAKLEDLDFPFYVHNGQIKKLDIEGKIKDGNLEISSLDKSIKVVYKKHKDLDLYLNGIDLYIKDTNANNKSLVSNNLNLYLKDTNIKVQDFSFLSKDVQINIIKDKIKFKGIFSNIDLPLAKKGKKVSKLDISGFYDTKNDILDLQTKDKKLSLNLKDKDKLNLKIDSFDLLYDTKAQSESTLKSLIIDAKNSNILINNKYKVLAKSYKLNIADNKQNLVLKNKNIFVTYIKNSDGTIELKANNLSDKFLNSALNKDLISGGKVMVIANGKNNRIQGKVILSETNIKNLTILTNLITLINASPALINPLLAIPSITSMATSKGFTFTGYKVNDGYIDFIYDLDSEFLNLTKIVTVGNGVDFEGNLKMDFNTSLLNGELDLIFFKGYSKIVGAVPVLNYILLGDEKKVETKVEISGTIDDPKIKSNVAEDSLNAPVNVIKRIITSPFKLFE
ncbi:YhdP family protein [Arcobacter sp. CECT 8986]|uniref:YhdP family protein n=1 Tax=Arcobacter sp. CECT 8986 TaxID=2044507 RepID=UPI0013E96260|nr:AsmA-like C-terminal domain-containing protein [Arcobacter sp. CECT 8986]